MDDLYLLEEYVDLRLGIEGLDRTLRRGWDICGDMRCLIITDLGKAGRHLAPSLAIDMSLALQSIGCDTSLHIMDKEDTQGSFCSIDEDLLRSIDRLGSRGAVLICLSNDIAPIPDSYGGGRLKDHLIRKGLKVVYSKNLADISPRYYETFRRSASFDPVNDMDRYLRVKILLDRGKTMHIRTAKGTDLSFSIEGREARMNIGDHRYGGTNLPFGEIYIAPIESRSFGTAVIDGSTKSIHGTSKIDGPGNDIVMKFDDGRLVNTSSEDIEDTIKHAENNDPLGGDGISVLSEVGIGINPEASLTGLMLVDEKVAGTAHIAIGSNTSFGGKNRCSYHFDQIFKNPEIYIDGIRLDL